MNWKAWLKGLAAAAVGGAATGAAQIVGGTGTVDKDTGVVALVGGLGMALTYLLQSPLKVGGAQIVIGVPPTQPPPVAQKLDPK